MAELLTPPLAGYAVTLDKESVTVGEERGDVFVSGQVRIAHGDGPMGLDLLFRATLFGSTSTYPSFRYELRRRARARDHWAQVAVGSHFSETAWRSIFLNCFEPVDVLGSEVAAYTIHQRLARLFTRARDVAAACGPALMAFDTATLYSFLVEESTSMVYGSAYDRP